MISLDPVFPAGVHKDGSSNNVGFEEYLRIFDGTIYMAFCRKIDHHVRVFLLKKSIDSFPVCDAFLNKTEIWIVHDRGKGRKIAGIGKAVQADDPVVRVFVEHVKNEVGTDETGSSGYDNIHNDSFLLISDLTQSVQIFPIQHIL